MTWRNYLIQYWRSYHLFILSFVAIVIFLVAIFFIFFAPRQVPVMAGNCSFTAKLALTAREQYRGLSGRKNISTQEGMLFIFTDVADKTFVMREMNFPLDIIFIRDHKVVNLYRNLLPEGKQPQFSYPSGSPVDAVLEIPGGQSQHCRLGVGSAITW